jgi:hypothetical protein
MNGKQVIDCFLLYIYIYINIYIFVLVEEAVPPLNLENKIQLE